MIKRKETLIVAAIVSLGILGTSVFAGKKYYNGSDKTKYGPSSSDVTYKQSGSSQSSQGSQNSQQHEQYDKSRQINSTCREQAKKTHQTVRRAANSMPGMSQSVRDGLNKANDRALVSGTYKQQCIQQKKGN